MNADAFSRQNTRESLETGNLVSGTVIPVIPDPVGRDVLGCWSQNKRPGPGEHQEISKAALTLLWQWDCLVKQNGVLYHQIFCLDGAEILQV